MYKAIDDKKTDIFLNPIPRWITHYSFAIIIILLGILIASALFIKYPTTLSLKVILTKDKAIAQTDFDTYKKLRSQQNILINNPFIEINGTIKKQDGFAIDNVIFLPITINDSLLKKLPFKDKLTCQGEIRIENKSILVLMQK